VALGRLGGGEGWEGSGAKLALSGARRLPSGGYDRWGTRSLNLEPTNLPLSNQPV